MGQPAAPPERRVQLVLLEEDLATLVLALRVAADFTRALAWGAQLATAIDTPAGAASLERLRAQLEILAKG